MLKLFSIKSQHKKLQCEAEKVLMNLTNKQQSLSIQFIFCCFARDDELPHYAINLI